MKTLKQYNDEKDKIRAIMEGTYQSPAGVLCDCGTELLYSDNMILLSMPPKRNVHCPKCGFKGYKS